MSSKRNQMREKAKHQLTRKNPHVMKPVSKVKNPPSFMSGFWLIFLGSTTLVIFYTIGQLIIGIFAGTAFIIMGGKRITRSSMNTTKKALKDS